MIRNRIDRDADPALVIVDRALCRPEEKLGLYSGSCDALTPVTCDGVHRLVEAQVVRTPDAVAVLATDGASLTYRELDRQANRLAHHLIAMGVAHGAVVAIHAARTPQAMVALLGVLKAGAAYLPLDPAYPRERMAMMIEDGGVDVLLSQGDVARLPAAPGRRVVNLDDDVLLRGDVSGDVTDLGLRVTADQCAYVIFTSGSTGRPKGIAMGHAALINLITWQLGDSQVNEAQARTLQFSPLSFDVSFQEIFATWSAGGTLVLIPEELRRDPHRLLQLMVERRVERLFLPFAALQQLAEAATSAPVLPPLREVITAGEQLLVTPAIITWFSRMSGCSLHNHYGPSESHVVTAHALTGDPTRWESSPPIGRPITNARIRILDPDGRPVPVGEVGELFIGGPVLANGYLGRADLTTERFVTDPVDAGAGVVYRTGDLARWREDGAIIFLGRADDQVKLRGYRIEPGEVEAALLRHPRVQEAAAAVCEIAPGDLRLVAYVVAPGAGPGFPAAVRHELATRLPDHLVPSAVVVMERLPLTPSGKVDRRALPRPVMDRAQLSSTYVAPGSPLEVTIAATWREILRADQVGVDDNFFELGGSSLLAVRVHARLCETLGRDFPLLDLFAFPNVAALARHLASLESGGQAAPGLSMAQERAQRQRDALGRQRQTARKTNP
jgi:amino acid adenylation domain-containing protein